MKLNSMIISGVLAATLAVASCTDDKKAVYTPAPPTPSVPAYFNLDQQSLRAEADVQGQTTYAMKVYRANPAGEATVNVMLENPDGYISTQPTVTFADGASTAEIILNFDPETLGVGNPTDFKLILPDSKDTPYFLSTIECSLIYVPWQTLGEAAFTDDFVLSLFGGRQYQWDVTVQEHPLISGYYRLLNPYENFPGYAAMADFATYDDTKAHNMYIHAEDPDAVYVETFNTGVSFGEYGELSAASKAYINLKAGATLDEVKNLCGKMSKNMVITFPTNSFALSLSNFYNGDWSILMGNANGKMRIGMPGAPDEWRLMGEGMYTDNLIWPLYTGYEGEAYPVRVYANNEIEGLYRMANPYKDTVCPYGASYEGDIFIEIDATDPRCILVPTQYTGWDDTEIDGGQGETYMLNAAYYLILNFGTADGSPLTKDDMIEFGLNDTLENGVMTFFVNNGDQHLLVYWPDCTLEIPDKDYPFWSAGLAATTLTLPDEAVNAIRARSTIVTNGANIVNARAPMKLAMLPGMDPRQVIRTLACGQLRMKR